MKFNHLFGIALTCLAYGCASTSSHILVGTRRPAVEPHQVRLYLRAPSNHEEIAIVCADSQNSCARTAQRKMDAAIANLKVEAAKLGANGILLNTVGDQYGGSSGGAFGVASGAASSPGGANMVWTSSFATPVFNKVVTGIAVYIPQE